MIARTAQNESAIDHTRRYKHTLFSVLVIGAFLLAFTGFLNQAFSEEPTSPNLTFDQHEIVLKSEQHQTVLTGFFCGGDMANIATVTVDENDDRHFRIYALENGAWASVLEASLSSSVLFVDVANINGHDRLITYEHGSISWFDPITTTKRPLVEVTTSYNAGPDGLGYAAVESFGPTDEGEIPLIDITRDLNGNGRDDLALPDVDGFWISTQMSDGSFSKPKKLGPPEPFRNEIASADKRSYGEVGISAMTIPWYLSRVYEMDYNQDGRSDLVFWNEDHFDVYLQEANGLFSDVAKPFAVNVSFDSDGAYSLLFGLIEGNTFSLVTGFRKKTNRTVLRSVRDMNDDGIPDLLKHTLQGRSILRLQCRYEIYFGTTSPDGIKFAQDASTAIEPRGNAGGMEPGGYSSLWLEDFDGNGQVDILRGDIKIGVGAIVRALLGRSITMSAELYRMEDGVYPDKATAKRKITTDFDISGERGGGRDAGFFPFVLVGDVNGDRRLDVLAGKNREELHVFLGVPGPESFARKPQKVAVTLPGDERNTWLVNMNNDGKQDVLMHFPSTTEPHRVTMLIAR